MNQNTRRIIAIISVIFFLAAGVNASKYFLASNVIEDEVQVVMDNTKKPLQIKYIQGAGLGGEDKRIKATRWENFGIKIKNNSSKKADSWENVLIRTKIYGIDKENLHLKYRKKENWKKTEIRDLRIIEPKVGGFGDARGNKGWEIEAQTKKELYLKLKVDKAVENLKIRLKAISKENGYKTPELSETKSKNLTEPSLDTFIEQENPSSVNKYEKYLEVTTENNLNSHAVLNFHVPDNVETGTLRLYQYWGSGYKKLREMNVKIQVFSIPENIDNSEIFEGLDSERSMKRLSEKRIKEDRSWYSFEIENIHPKENNVRMLIRFEQNNFDNQKRRIRFYSKEKGTYAPYLLF